MATPAQIAANRRNALKSTGPRTAAGKATSSRNALRHGLAARAAVVLGEDPADRERFRAELRAALAPRDGREEWLAETAVEAAWRLRRAWRAEAALFNRRGRLDLAPACLRELLILQRYEVAASRRFHRAIAMLEHGRRLEHVPTSRNRRFLSGSPNQVVFPHENRRSESSCPRVSRASTFSSAAKEHMDGRDEHGHDDNRENEGEKRLSDAVPRPESDRVAMRQRGSIQPNGNRSKRRRPSTAAPRRAARNHRFRARNPIWRPRADSQPLGVVRVWSSRRSRLAFAENRLISWKSALKGHQVRENPFPMRIDLALEGEGRRAQPLRLQQTTLP